MDNTNIEYREFYHSNGTLMYKYQYIADKKQGEQLRYYSNGELKYKDYYKDGKSHGEQLTYHNDGKLWYTLYYISGDEVSEEEWIVYNRLEKLKKLY